MRNNFCKSLLLCCLAIATFSLAGCDSADKKESAKADPHAGHDHESGDHDDHPAHGPFGGHIFDLDTPDHQVEWKKYKDNDMIRMYILDGQGQKATPVKVDSFTVTPKIGNDGTNFVLEPEEVDDNGATAVYALDDKDLSIAIPNGVTIEIKVGDKTLKGEIKAHAPLDH